MSDWDDEEESVPSRPSAYVSPASKAAPVVDDWGDDVPRLTSGPQGSRGGRGRGGGDRDSWNNAPRGRGGFRGGASSGNGWGDNSANDRGFRGGGRGSRGFGRGGHSAPSNDWSDDEGTKSRNFAGSVSLISYIGKLAKQVKLMDCLEKSILHKTFIKDS